MKPVLYGTTEKLFDSMGVGVLTDCLSCTVTEERNGEYELEATYPISGELYSEIAISMQLYVKPSDGASLQPFRIYKITKPIGGVITIYAQHVRYQMSHIPLMPFTAGSAAECISKIANNAAEACPFTFSTDVNVTATYSQTVPASMLSRLGGVTGSVIDCYGGEWEFDGYKAILHAARGADRGVVLRYGVNLTDLKQEETIESTYTGVCPYWSGSDGTVITLSEKVVESDKARSYPYRRTKVVDFSSEFTDQPTEAELREKAEAYIEDNDIGVPAVSIDLSFVNLADTVEYAEYQALERVHLCDTVTVLFERLGVEAQAKVTKTVYDVLLEKYDKITVGSTVYSLADRIKDLQTEIEDAQNGANSWTAKAVQSATEQIRGEHGGSIVTRLNANGDPYELLIMDTDDTKTAQKVWRWNLAGLGYSKDGIDGDYGLAITQDGVIVADYITAGTMSANRIKAGVLEDAAGNFYLDMSTGELVMKNARLSGEIRTGVFDTVVDASSTRQGAVLSGGSLKCYENGKLVSTIGAFHYVTDTSVKGLEYGLNADGQFCGFSAQPSDGSSTTYSPLLRYSRSDDSWNFQSKVIKNFKVLDTYNSNTAVSPYTGYCSWYSGSNDIEVKMYFYCGIMYKWDW